MIPDASNSKNGQANSLSTAVCSVQKSIKAEFLEFLLYRQTQQRYNVKYKPKYGWLFWNDEYAEQRLAYTYEHAIVFIMEFDWKSLLQNIEHERG